MWKRYCPDMFKVPPPLFGRGGREVRLERAELMNKETTVQECDATMMTKESKTRNKIIITSSYTNPLINNRRVEKCSII